MQIKKQRSILLQLSILALCILVISNCSQDPPSELSPVDRYYHLSIPPGFPEPHIPEDNKLSDLRIALGKKLFFEKALSADGKVSCASCHFPEIGFSDFDRFSEGSGGAVGFRNAPGLVNVAYGKSFFRDGGVPTLELQVLAPFDSERELNLPIIEAVNLLNEDPEYKEMFHNAYQRNPDPFSIIRAIAAFERTFISGNSRYDQYANQGKENVLNSSELEGMKLFLSNKTKCASCHSGFNFTNETFQNNGIYEIYADSGRTRITLDRAHFGQFKVPTLRNIALTGPYMHDGSFATLGEVIDHYARGGKNHFNQSPLVSGFEMTTQEKTDLINFLKALTDASFITNPDFRQ